MCVFLHACKAKCLQRPCDERQRRNVTDVNMQISFTLNGQKHRTCGFNLHHIYPFYQPPASIGFLIDFCSCKNEKTVDAAGC